MTNGSLQAGDSPPRPGSLGNVRAGLHAFRRRVIFWCLAVILLMAVVVAEQFAPGLSPLPAAAWPGSAAVFLAIVAVAFVCEYVDSSLGMGYGTTLTPLLLLFGQQPLEVVPAILISELLTGLLAGVLHHHDGNVDFVRDRRAQGVAALLSALSLVGAVVAAVVAVKIKGDWLKLAIAFIILGVGVLTILTWRRQLRFRAGHIVVLGAVAAFNKGLSGGGYGPLVTGGQVVSGVTPKQAVAITSLAEAWTCLVGIVAYWLLEGPPKWSLVVPLAVGAIMSVPAATLTIRRLSQSMVRAAVGVVAVVLGLVTLVKVFV